jgi:hypothetical protein
MSKEEPMTGTALSVTADFEAKVLAIISANLPSTVTPAARDPLRVIVGGQWVTLKELKRMAPADPEGNPCEGGMTHKEFVEFFFRIHKVKLPIFGAARAGDNGRELSALSKEGGYTVGKAQHTRFDYDAFGDVLSVSNVYPYEVLRQWVEAKTEGKFEMPIIPA